MSHPIAQTKEITLKHNQNFFSLEFSALNYINPTQTYYRYQLTGIDHSEREIRSSAGKGYATYTNIPPGTYTFRVQAADNNEIWSNKYAEMKITVKAPFWKRHMLTYFTFCSSQEVSYSSSLYIYNANAGSCCVTKKKNWMR